jgi:HPt (histidine-containing phosphotransfer) domain-containing protein
MSEVFNPSEVLDQIGGEEELLKEMIDIFLSIYADDLDAIDQAISSKDSESIRTTAHRMKGSVSNFGKRGAFLAAKIIEENASEGNISGMTELYDELVHQLLALENELKVYNGAEA